MQYLDDQIHFSKYEVYNKAHLWNTLFHNAMHSNGHSKSSVMNIRRLTYYLSRLIDKVLLDK